MLPTRKEAEQFPANQTFSKEEIKKQIYFQEQYFESEIIIA